MAISNIIHPMWLRPVAAIRRAIGVGLALVTLLGTVGAPAQDRNSGGPSSPQEARVALIIGNSDYKSAPLENPANDAADLANALEKQGFKVLVRENVGERGLKEAVDVFARHLKQGGIGLFFFAGHGIQLKDQNFLLPVDIGFDSEADITFKSVSAEYVLSRMAEAGNRINVVILDACRNNPFQQARKNVSKGLGVMNVGRAEKGTFIAYATSPGATAADGTGRNGLYTKHLLRSLETRDSDIDKVFGRVRTGVVQDTGGDQVPWTSSSVIGSFHFDLVEDMAALRGATQPAAARHEAAAEAATAPYDPVQERAYWERIKDSRVAADFVGYLEKFSGAPRAAYARWMATKYGGVVPAIAARPAPVTSPEPERLALATPSPPPQLPAGSALSGAIPSPGTVIHDCAECPELVAVAPGEYTMGSGPKERLREPDEEPAHRVRVATSIAVGKYEVTRGQYSAFVKETGREQKPGCHSTRGGVFHKNPKATWQNPGFEQKDDDPVVCVSWDDAQAYLAWLGKKTAKQYRLLNESEWEYVARAGTTGSRHWADADQAATCRYASVADTTFKSVSPGAPLFPCSDGFAFTAPVGRFPANPFGIHDLLGNAWEWTEDCWNEGYAGAPALAAPRLTGSCAERVFRGGAWNSAPSTVRAAYRDRGSKDERHDNLGFRAARSLP
ncbi:SUMF1/EgtB/PvdO family nonheme iron enzyme [Sulfuritalea sp.]|uniref:SUMF1/EgtB/PvdO family nonheme iron enzyme n=1 Tax=Sulfuritalea sp. TaxID=2480090 RepID=UPI001AC3D078|nr:SUMF1/EgtB/PvdO family nonheme iron enzyme [Sulfuritalea sp.]MBN8475893.1 SUMF1/EgtB/PvdO family nonheme iron enzyme [Sulfuritalea sp.]